MHSGSWLLVVGTIVAGGACAHGRPKLAHAAPAPAVDSTVHLDVTNNYAQPVDVYARSADTDYLMGTVEPGIERHFDLRKAMLANGGSVEFVAVPADFSQPVRSGELLLKPGDIVDFVVATTLEGSTATVRP